MVSKGTQPVEPATLSGLVLPGERPRNVVAFEMQVVEFFVDAADLLGVPKSVAALYGIVFASPEPLSFADIEGRLDISKGSISQGLRVLREVGALKVVSLEPGTLNAEGLAQSSSLPAPGSNRQTKRGDCYVPDLELRKLVTRFLEHRLKRQLDAGTTRLAGLKRAIPSGNKRSSNELNRRLKSLTDWHTRAQLLLPMARTFLKLTPG